VGIETDKLMLLDKEKLISIIFDLRSSNSKYIIKSNNLRRKVEMSTRNMQKLKKIINHIVDHPYSRNG